MSHEHDSKDNQVEAVNDKHFSTGEIDYWLITGRYLFSDYLFTQNTKLERKQKSTIYRQDTHYVHSFDCYYAFISCKCFETFLPAVHLFL